MPYVIVKDIKDSIGWQFTGAARLIAPKDGASKAQRALCDFVVTNRDPEQAVKKALTFDTLESRGRKSMPSKPGGKNSTASHPRRFP